MRIEKVHQFVNLLWYNPTAPVSDIFHDFFQLLQIVSILPQRNAEVKANALAMQAQISEKLNGNKIALSYFDAYKGENKALLVYLTLLPELLNNIRLQNHFFAEFCQLTADIGRCYGKRGEISFELIKEFFTSPFDYFVFNKKPLKVDIFQPPYYAWDTRDYNIFDNQFVSAQTPEVQADIKAYIQKSADVASVTTVAEKLFFLDGVAANPIQTKTEYVSLPDDKIKQLELTLIFRLYNEIRANKIHDVEQSKAFIINEYEKLNTEKNLFPYEDIKHPIETLNHICALLAPLMPDKPSLKC